MIGLCSSWQKNWKCHETTVKHGFFFYFNFHAYINLIYRIVYKWTFKSLKFRSPICRICKIQYFCIGLERTFGLVTKWEKDFGLVYRLSPSPRSVIFLNPITVSVLFSTNCDSGNVVTCSVSGMVVVITTLKVCREWNVFLLITAQCYLNSTHDIRA